MVKRYSHAIYMAKSNGEKIFFCRRKIFFFANIVFTVFDPTDASVWNITCFYFFKNFFSLSPGNFYAIMSFFAPSTRYFTYILLLNIRLFGRKYFGHKNRKKTLEILSYWCPVLYLSITHLRLHGPFLPTLRVLYLITHLRLHGPFLPTLRVLYLIYPPEVTRPISADPTSFVLEYYPPEVTQPTDIFQVYISKKFSSDNFKSIYPKSVQKKIGQKFFFEHFLDI